LKHNLTGIVDEHFAGHHEDGGLVGSKRFNLNEILDHNRRNLNEDAAEPDESLSSRVFVYTYSDSPENLLPYTLSQIQLVEDDSPVMYIRQFDELDDSYVYSPYTSETESDSLYERPEHRYSDLNFNSEELLGDDHDDDTHYMVFFDTNFSPNGMNLEQATLSYSNSRFVNGASLYRQTPVISSRPSEPIYTLAE
jgi:hypothetical protein